MSHDPIDYLVERNAGGLDVRNLSKIFKDTTNCYKILFFKAMLDLSQGQPAQELSISLASIADAMIFHAWYPLKYFRLSLGSQDRLGKIVDELSSSTESSKLNPQQLKSHIATSTTTQQRNELLRYVPFRLLTPFFADELQGLPDHQKNDAIAELSSELMCSEKPPVYAVNQLTGEIIIHEKWVSFLNENYLILDGWCNYYWAMFLQSRNPSVPAVINKLTKPEARSSLSFQRQVWRTYLESRVIPCVYTSNPISVDDFSLDHIIPWSFVCHDYLWNLVPTPKSANSSKGTKLPSQGQIQTISGIQFHFLEEVNKNFPRVQKKRVFEEFMNELKLDERELLNWKRFKSSYEDSLGALKDVARHNGF